MNHRGHSCIQSLGVSKCVSMPMPRQYDLTYKLPYFPTILRACTVILCVLCGLAPFGARADLRAGAARVSITPDPSKMPYTLGGYGDPRRFKTKATGIHDTCYARALVLENNGTKC